MRAGLRYFILAGVVGVLAVILVHSYIRSRTSQPIQATGEVVVADVNITPGTMLTDRMVHVATYPQGLIPDKAITNVKALQNRVASVDISKGEPILLTKLAPEGTQAGLGGLLEPNKLAVTVKTDEVSGVAGFINPGDRVDVMVEMQEPGEGGEHFSKIILQNIKVLSKGQIMDQTSDRNNPQVVPTVTLEVTPEQAEALNLATFQGRVRLALRNQADRTIFATSGVVTSQLAYKRGLVAPPPPTKPEEAGPQKSRESRQVKVIKGMNVSVAEF